MKIYTSFFRTKTYLFILFLSLLYCPLALAQIKLGDNAKTINPNALLEMESSARGLLLPRMTTAQRDAALTANLPNGLLIFNTTEDCFQVYRASKGAWDCLDKEQTAGALRLENNKLILNDSSVDLTPFLTKEEHKLRVEAGDVLTSIIVLDRGKEAKDKTKDNTPPMGLV